MKKKNSSIPTYACLIKGFILFFFFINETMRKTSLSDLFYRGCADEKQNEKEQEERKCSTNRKKRTHINVSHEYRSLLLLSVVILLLLDLLVFFFVFFFLFVTLIITIVFFARIRPCLKRYLSSSIIMY